MYCSSYLLPLYLEILACFALLPACSQKSIFSSSKKSPSLINRFLLWSILLLKLSSSLSCALLIKAFRFWQKYSLKVMLLWDCKKFIKSCLVIVSLLSLCWWIRLCAINLWSLHTLGGYAPPSARPWECSQSKDFSSQNKRSGASVSSQVSLEILESFVGVLKSCGVFRKLALFLSLRDLPCKAWQSTFFIICPLCKMFLKTFESRLVVLRTPYPLCWCWYSALLLSP